MSTQTPVQTKRKVEDTDFTPDKISYKIGKTMDAEAANTLIKKTDMNFLKETGRFLPKLLSSSEIEITETIPKEVVKELLNKGVLDKDMFLTEEDGAKKKCQRK